MSLRRPLRTSQRSRRSRHELPPVDSWQMRRASVQRLVGTRLDHDSCRSQIALTRWRSASSRSQGSGLLACLSGENERGQDRAYIMMGILPTSANGQLKPKAEWPIGDDGAASLSPASTKAAAEPASGHYESGVVGWSMVLPRFGPRGGAGQETSAIPKAEHNGATCRNVSCALVGRSTA
jgi:hypothetical protein